jgi:hypothetical protein
MRAIDAASVRDFAVTRTRIDAATAQLRALLEAVHDYTTALESQFCERGDVHEAVAVD